MPFCDLANDSFDKFDRNNTLVNMRNIYSCLYSRNQDLSMLCSVTLVIMYSIKTKYEKLLNEPMIGNGIFELKIPTFEEGPSELFVC